MKKIINFLKKIGLLHSSSGDYMTGEFDNNKVNLKTNDVKQKNKKNFVNILFWLFIISGIVLILLSLIVLGFSFWFFIIFILWIYLVFSIKKSIVIGTFIFRKAFLFLFVIVFINILIIIFNIPSETNNINNSKKINTENYDSFACEAQKFEYKDIPRVETSIIGSYKEGYPNRTKKEYSLTELSDFGYQVELLSDGDDIYLLSQICDGDELAIVSVRTKDQKKSGNKKGWSTMSFFDGAIKDKLIVAGKEYQLYGYYSLDGEKWFIDKKINFKVKK